MEFHVEDQPNPLDIEVLEGQIRREASAATGLGDEVDLAIFVREAGTVVAGISGWTWGDCCELQNLWVEPHLRGRGLATQLIAAAEAEAAARGCSQTVHFTYAFQAQALYEQNGYELVGRVKGFPSGTDVLWYRKGLQPMLNRPHSITAEVTIPDAGAEGVLLCQGTAAGGFSLYVKDGTLRYVHNYVGRGLHEVRSEAPLTVGEHVLRFEFEPTGQPDLPAGKGAPGKLQLYVDGTLVVRGDR